MSEPSCGGLADVADELALGALTGRERAQALAHLEICESCQEVVRRRSAVADELPGLLPPRDPPPGFGAAVLARISLAVPRPGPRHGGKSSVRERCLAAAGVLTIACAGAAGWGLGSAAPQAGQAGSGLVSAALLTPGHRAVGHAFAYRTGPGWAYITVDLGSGNESVNCQVTGPGGQVDAAGTFWLANGRGSWGGPASGGPGWPAAVRLVAAGGTVLATASFTPR